MTQVKSNDDPKPAPPPEPDLEACCGQGCNPCIFDLYEEARVRYEAELKAWEERQASAAPRRAGEGRRQRRQ